MNVLVFKGGIVLWDFRIVYDNMLLIVKRLNFDRWCFVVFVSMMFVIWVSEKDMEFKRDVYW